MQNIKTTSFVWIHFYKTLFPMDYLFQQLLARTALRARVEKINSENHARVVLRANKTKFQFSLLIPLLA